MVSRKYKNESEKKFEEKELFEIIKNAWFI